MVTRLLFFILIVIGWILLVRFVKSWLAGSRGGRRSEREISGEWVVVTPLGQATATQVAAMGESLEVSDPEYVAMVASVLEVVQRAHGGPELDMSEVRGLAARLGEAAETPLIDDNGPLPQGWLRAASRLVMEKRPDLAEYEARKAVRHAYGGLFPGKACPFFAAEPRLVHIPNGPDAPGIDQRFMSFLEGVTETDEGAFKWLFTLDTESLPDGAMLPLLHLFATHDPSTARLDSNGVTLSDLLERYGDRLYPAAVEYLTNPSQYGHRADSGWYLGAFRLAGNWSESCAQPLFRAALESGWNDCATYAPDTNWAAMLIASFSDSPYGPVAQ